jgi:hypothetical protein
LSNQFFATTPLRSVLAAIPPESGVATVDGFRSGADNPAVAHRRRRRAGAVVRRGRARALHPRRRAKTLALRDAAVAGEHVDQTV